MIWRKEGKNNEKIWEVQETEVKSQKNSLIKGIRGKRKMGRCGEKMGKVWKKSGNFRRKEEKDEKNMTQIISTEL